MKKLGDGGITEMGAERRASKPNLSIVLVSDKPTRPNTWPSVPGPRQGLHLHGQARDFHVILKDALWPGPCFCYIMNVICYNCSNFCRWWVSNVCGINNRIVPIRNAF